MKKYLAIIILASVFCNVYSQHELSFSLGTVVSGYDLESYVNQDLEYNPYYSELESSVSPKVGLNINLGYAYYFKYNLRAFLVSSIQQQGYSDSDSHNYDNPGSSLYDYEWNSSGKVNMNCLRSALGVSYLTDFNMTFSAGFSKTFLMSMKASGEYSTYYPNNPSLSLDGLWATTDSLQISSSPLFLGVGYEIGNISFDVNINSIQLDPPFGFDLNSVSFLVGYRKLLIK